jgi:hypothetical protein
MIVAHSGHWLVNLMFALPAVLFIGWLGFIAIKDRRNNPQGDKD